MYNFIEKSRKIHGDKYDYSKVEYVNANTKVRIICPEHGEFWQTPNNHLRGCGCPMCKAQKNGDSKRSNRNDFIEKATAIHGNKYDYSKVVYTNNSTKVCIICPEHGEFWQTPNHHLQKHGCQKCANVEKQTTKDFICKAKDIHGDKYDYSNVEYVNNHTKVCIICSEHGEFWQTPKNHLKGQGCPKCAVKIRATKNALSKNNFIEKAKKIHGDKYDYSKVEYINTHTKVCIICPEHGEFWQMPNEHLQGCGCSKCSNRIKLDTEEFIRRAREIHGNRYDYSKVEYINAQTKVKIICPIHGEFWQTPSGHLNGHGCSKCHIEKLKEEKRYSLNEWIEIANNVHQNKYDYSKSVYSSSNREIEIICPKHGSFWQIATEHLQGCGCPKCSHHISSYEIEIKDFIQNNISSEIKTNIRNLISGKKELDIYIPEKNMAIEFNGLIFHSEKCKIDKNYHLNKTRECEKQGIRLIHIFEDEWLYKKDIVKSMLTNILGFTDNKIFARKCMLKNVPPKDAMQFLDENHIQGRCKAKYHYGLYYNDELVSLMAFGCVKQQKKYSNDYENTYELLRFCNRLNTTIVGGASKLIKHFIKEIKPHEIIAYADKRWSNGNLYEKLGFAYSHDSKPNYFYVFGQRRENRFKYRKSELVKQGFDKNKSEHDIMQERRIYRIYDCGCKCYKLSCEPLCRKIIQIIDNG